jgi:hypothetical protein
VPLSIAGVCGAQYAHQAAPDTLAEVQLLVGLLIAADRMTGTTDIEDMTALQAIVAAARRRCALRSDC